MKFQDYADIVDNLLRRHWAITDSLLTQEAYNPRQGIIEGKITFLDGSYIDFLEEVQIDPNSISKSRYSY
ncbi:hypothetical protein HUU05_07535 [candidate division KSB1 bacterium]|nr:hypothetical protein [candidate division KSB1 bacterium]